MTVVVQTETSIWVWLAPVLLLVASMVTLYFTITSTKKREWNKWRRETLIKLCADAIDAAREAESKCELALTQGNILAPGSLKAAERAASRIETISEQLYLIGASFLADTCSELKSAADAINLPASHLRTARANAKSQEESETKVRQQQGGGGWSSPGPEWDAHMAAFREAKLRIYRDTVAEHDELYNSLRGELEKVRTRFVTRSRSELKATN